MVVSKKSKLFHLMNQKMKFKSLRVNMTNSVGG